LWLLGLVDGCFPVAMSHTVGGFVYLSMSIVGIQDNRVWTWLLIFDSWSREISFLENCI